jgi:ribonuclease D
MMAEHAPLPPAAYVRTSAHMREAMARLRAELAHDPLLAVDTEANSMYAYRERVCLIQLSTRQSDYIVDPLAGFDIGPLGELFSSDAVEKVFHAAEYDLLCLKRDYGFTFTRLFDTMIAARIVGMKAFGLGALLEAHIGVRPDKSHQRDDWGQRPLPKSSLQYAQTDTHYLPRLRDVFAERLSETERWQDAHEAFAELCHVEPARREFDPEGFWRLALPNQLNRRQAAVLREVYLLREQLAQERDVPPFKIFSDKTLVAFAQHAPLTPETVEQIDGMSSSQMRRYGAQVLEAVDRGTKARPPAPPPPEPPTEPAVVERYTALQKWRKQRGEARGVESDVILPRETLWALAQHSPASVEAMRSIRGLTDYRLQQYGAELLAVLDRFR